MGEIKREPEKSKEDELKEKFEKRLRELLTYENPKAEEYAELIKREEEATAQTKRNSDDEYHTHFLPSVNIAINNMEKKDPEAFQRLMKNLVKSLLFDLGGNGMDHPHYKDQAIELDTHVSVNRYSFPHDVAPNPRSVTLFNEQLIRDGKLRVPAGAVIKSDMLDFVSRLAADSQGNIMINGIDSSIIFNPKYHAALAEEITRAIKSGAIVMGSNSEVLDLLLESKKFKLVSDKGKRPTPGMSAYILEKI